MAHHPAPERLSGPLDPLEQAHVDACLRCRAERRRLQAPSEPQIRLGPYEVVGLIGAGGMARVYAVRHPRTGESRAVKVLSLPNAAARERFAREARGQRRVDHPNVLPILDVLAGDQPGLVLPLVGGPSLAVLLASAPPPLPQRLALFREIVAGVAAIHAAGLVHRDVKPANVLLDASGEVLRPMVADFGLAKALAGAEETGLTRTGAGLGTPAYMAPEQREDASQVTARADVWALGALLYELRTGQRPPAGLTAPVPDGSEWELLLARLLAVDPAERPADARQVLVALPPTEALGTDLLGVCRQLAPVPVLSTLPIDGDLGGWGPTGTPHNLPPDADDFLGREQELSELAGLLVDGNRVVSVLGLGGVGKTRLALRYASVWLDDHPGGAWLCELSEAADEAEIARAVAASLQVTLIEDDPVPQVGRALAARGRCLILLDRFDRAVPCAEQTVGRWLDMASLAQFLITTRQVLGLRGERVFELAPAASGPPALDRTWESLSPDERLALVQLSALGGGFTMETAEAVLALDGGWPLDVVQRLVNRSLVRQIGAETFEIVESVSAWVREHPAGGES